MTPDEAFAWIRQRVEWSDQGWLAYLFTDDRPAADNLRTHLEAWFAAQDLPFEAVRPGRPDELASLGPRLAQLPGSLWVEALFESDRWETAWVDCLLRLNSQRDTMLSEHRMVLFVAPTSSKTRIQAAGPDLWAKHERIMSLGQRVRSLPSTTAPQRGRLDSAALEHLYQTALELGLSDPSRRPLLLAWLPTAIVASLARHSSPADQMRGDLNELNRLLTDGQPALATWLTNAERLTSYLPRSKTFRVIGETLFHDAPVAAPAHMAFSTPKQARYDAFLIYGQRNRDVVAEVTRRLEGAGLRVFLDALALPPGEDWTNASLKAQERAKTSIWFVGEETTQRGTTSLLDRPEVAAAIDRERAAPGSLIAIHQNAFSVSAAEFMLPRSTVNLNAAQSTWDAIVDAIEGHIRAL